MFENVFGQNNEGGMNASYGVSHRVIKSIMMEVPAEHPIHHRPLEAVMNDEVHAKLAEATQDFSFVDSSSIREIARSVLRPKSQSAGVVAIEEGWQETRFTVFTMIETVTPNSTTIGVITWYTDRADLTVQGTPSPDTLLIPNGYVKLQEQHYMGANGRVRTFNVQSNEQVLRPLSIDTNGHQFETGLHTMRPYDMFAGIQNINSKAENPDLDIIDSRSRIGVTDNVGMASSRDNNISSKFLANTMRSFSKAMQDSNNDILGSGINNTLGKAGQNLKEKNLTSNAVFNHIINKTNMGYSGHISLQELGDLFPEIYDITDVRLLDPSMSRSNADMNEGWGSSGLLVQIQHALTHIIPAMNNQALLVDVDFIVTNQTMDGRVNVTLTHDPVPMFDGHLNDSKVAWFIDTIANDVIPEILDETVGQFRIHCRCNSYYTTQSTISINGSEDVSRSLPNYCDNLSTQVVTHNGEYASQTAGTIGDILRTTVGNSDYMAQEISY